MSDDEWPTAAELGEPIRPMSHAARRGACHEGDCTRCEQEREQAEATQ